MVNGAKGDQEEGKPRLVKTPWHKQAIPFEKAAEIGTQKVIQEHSTIGVVVTTDGSISDIPRENYLEAEEKVITQLKDLAKPFVVVVNSNQPNNQDTLSVVNQIQNKYNVIAVSANCLELEKKDVENILTLILTQFPIKEISVNIPKWIAMQDYDFKAKAEIMKDIKKNFADINKISEITIAGNKLLDNNILTDVNLDTIDYGTGCAVLNVDVDKELYYDTLKEITGEDVKDDWALMKLMQNLIYSQREYEKIAPALKQVEATGYGIVMPSIEQLQLEEPEMVKQGSKFGVKLTASAPSLHILKANIETTVSPIVGSESMGEELVNSMMKNFESDPLEIWKSNLFGNSLQDLVTQGLNAKLLNIPQEARGRLADTVEKVVNEGCQGLVCIIL